MRPAISRLDEALMSLPRLVRLVRAEAEKAGVGDEKLCFSAATRALRGHAQVLRELCSRRKCDFCSLRIGRRGCALESSARLLEEAAKLIEDRKIGLVYRESALAPARVKRLARIVLALLGLHLGDELVERIEMEVARYGGVQRL